jgi:hypothetical protein
MGKALRKECRMKNVGVIKIDLTFALMDRWVKDPITNAQLSA